MQVGDLVIINRPSLNIRKGTLGLVIKIVDIDADTTGVGLDGEFGNSRLVRMPTAEVLPHGEIESRQYLIQDLMLYKSGKRK